MSEVELNIPTKKIIVHEFLDAIDNGVFIGDDYFCDEDAVYDYLYDMEPDERPTEGIAAKRFDYKVQFYMDALSEDIHGRVGEECYNAMRVDEELTKLAPQFNELHKAIEALNFHWFQPMDNRLEKHIVKLPTKGFDNDDAEP